MEKQASYFGVPGETTVHPAILVAVIICCLLILFLSRKNIIAPFLFVAILVPFGQKFIIANLAFMMLRVVLAAAMVRLLMVKLKGQEEILSGGWRTIDKAVLCWGIISTITFTLHFQVFGAFIYRAGMLYTGFGTYFFLRYLIRDEEDVDRAIRAFAGICTVCAAIMVYEQNTGRTFFGMFGGFREFLEVRGGRARAQAAFSHPILAGTFAATLLPLFVGLLWRNKSKIIAWAGIVFALVMCMTSASSTPIMAVLAGALALCLWRLRNNMRAIRWGIVFVLVGLHLVMKAPVWALIARMDLVGGSSGYHRYELVNQFIIRFGEWWMFGADTSNWGTDMWDTSNQWVEVGVQGGIITLIAFTAIVVYCFSALGKSRKILEESAQSERARAVWIIGSALFAHAIGLFGISYFDQTIVSWYALLAMICAVTAVAIPDLAEEPVLPMPPVFGTASKKPVFKPLGPLLPELHGRPSGTVPARPALGGRRNGPDKNVFLPRRESST